MKKLFVFVLVLMLSAASCAFAEDLGVQVIGGEEAATTPVSLDDMQVGTAYTIDGYAIVQPQEYLVVDCFAQFGENDDYSIIYKTNYGFTPTLATVFSYANSACDYDADRYTDAGWMDSGNTAQFIWLRTDVTNLTKGDINFVEEASVKVVYQDEYEFTGWIRQIDYDKIDMNHSDGCVTRYSVDSSSYPSQIVLNPAKNEPISMMYCGNYVFGCTVPNSVIEDKESPLRMVIQLGDNELTYNIRK